MVGVPSPPRPMSAERCSFVIVRIAVVYAVSATAAISFSIEVKSRMSRILKSESAVGALACAERPNYSWIRTVEVAQSDVTSCANDKSATVMQTNSIGRARRNQLDCINNGTHLVTHKNSDSTKHGEGKVIRGKTIS